jgi:hypothetical protein
VRVGAAALARLRNHCPLARSLTRVQATSRVYVVAGTGTCLGAGGTASSGVASNGTAFGLCRALAVWGSDGLFISSTNDHRVRLHNLTTGACGWWG